MLIVTGGMMEVLNDGDMASTEVVFGRMSAIIMIITMMMMTLEMMIMIKLKTL